MKPLPPFKPREARTEAADARAWTCETCDNMIESDAGRHCRTCAQYWDDVANGLFDGPGYD